MIDRYLFTYGKLIIIVYVDDVIIAGIGIEKLLASLKKELDIDTGKKNEKLKCFDFTDDKNLKYFLRVNIEKTSPDNLHIS